MGTAIGYVTQDEPQYRDTLRAIGAYLDWLQAEYVTVSEIDDGFIWHSFARGDLTRSVSGMVPHGELSRLMSRLKHERTGRHANPSRPPGAARSTRSAPHHAVCVEGYQETFRTIGARLDRVKALAVLLVEQDQKLVVNYRYPAPGYLRRDLYRIASAYGQQQDTFSADQLVEMVTAARGNRNSPYFR